MWRAEEADDPYFDACICSMLQALARSCRDLGIKALGCKQIQLLLMFLADADSATHILRSLLALPDWNDGKQGRSHCSSEWLC